MVMTWSMTGSKCSSKPYHQADLVAALREVPARGVAGA